MPDTPASTPRKSAPSAVSPPLKLAVDIAGGKSSLTLANPVMTASGTFSYGIEYAKLIDINRLGAIVSKTTTLRPRSGSPTQRIDETPAGMLNSIGLQNVGIDKLRRERH
jgi:dihydroorotate dehydrogenase (NAD+) catalytic subunit